MISDEIGQASLAKLFRRSRTLAARRETVARELRLIVDELRDRAKGGQDEAATKAFLAALDLLPSDELSHFDVMSITREHGMKTIPQADSFWRAILTRRRKKQLGVVPEKYLGIRKDQDERFAKTVGVAVVETIFRGDFGDVPRDIRPAVLKPVRASDSRGAFHLFQDEMFSIARSQPVVGWEQLSAVAAEEIGPNGLGGTQWELQTMVTKNGLPAHDLKFYCFYGEIGAVLEISRYPAQQYAYFDTNLNPIEFRLDKKPGFDDVAATSIMSGAVTSDKLEVVKDLSRRIPVPFMRIDFLEADDQLIFCEFSSAPGQSHSLVPEHDRRLGAMYHAAEIRLINDLLDGKGFDTFREFSRAR